MSFFFKIHSIFFQILVCTHVIKIHGLSKLIICIYLKLFSLYVLNNIMIEEFIICLEKIKYFVQVLKDKYSFIWKTNYRNFKLFSYKRNKKRIEY